jgi:hypothetical protein
MYNVVYKHCIITLFNVGNVLLCVIYQQTLPYLCLLHEYHVIYSVRYCLRFHVTAVRSWNVSPVDTGALLN